MRENGQSVRSSPANVDQAGPGSNRSTAIRLVRALDSGVTQSSTKQCSAPHSDLSICALRSGRQIRRKTDLNKVCQLSTLTAVNSHGKRDLAAMAQADKPNSAAGDAEPLRKVVHGVLIIDSSIEGEQDSSLGRLIRIGNLLRYQVRHTVLLRWLPIRVTI